MAGGALPELYDPKEISGRKFWDGGVLVSCEIAKSTSDALGEDVQYEDLIRSRFEIKVMRIERKHDAPTSTSLKGADITIQPIEALIKEGEEDTKDLIIF